MANVVLQNEEALVQIRSKGAELWSFQDKKSGQEYMWNADPKHWGRCSPMLFPFVGGAREGKYITKGKAYSAMKHGFVRDAEFELVRSNDNEAWFAIASDEQTRADYPYEFRLEAGYRLEGKKLQVMWRVINPADETLYFSIGGHPAFKCPLEDGEELTDCSVRFGGEDKIVTSQISKAGMATDDKKEYILKDSRLSVTNNLFDRDALVLEGHQVQEVGLCRKDGSEYVTVSFSAPLFGVWSMPGAPFICVEPWYGRCDHEAFTGTLEEREYGNTAGPGKTWEASYLVEIK